MSESTAGPARIGQGCDFRLSPEDPRWLEAGAALELGLQLGMNLLDTAEVYSGGKSESVIGQLLKRHPKTKAWIASKVSPENLSAAKLVSSAEESLKRLQVESIYLYQIHWPNPKVTWSETAEALSRLQQAGKIQKIGICNVSLSELQEFEAALTPISLSAVQAEYNLFDRSVEVELLPYCQKTGKSFLAYSPLHQGHLASNQSQVKMLQGLAVQANLSPSQLILSWLLSKENVIPLPKALKAEHVKANAACLNASLSTSIISEIERFFPFKPQHIEPKKIRVVQDGLQARKAYTSVAEARENRFNLTPSPVEVAEQFLAGKFLKPIRVRPAPEGSTEHSFELIEGRLRYWGWVLAFGETKPIPALVQG